MAIKHGWLWVSMVVVLSASRVDAGYCEYFFRPQGTCRAVPMMWNCVVDGQPWRWRGWSFTGSFPDGREQVIRLQGDAPQRCVDQAWRRWVCFAEKCVGKRQGQSCPTFPHSGCGRWLR